jgi:hypothetical protein
MASARIKDRLQPDATVEICCGDKEERDLDKPGFIVGYWSILRGLGVPLRMMPSAAQIPHWV